MKILRIERCGWCPHMYLDRTIYDSSDTRKYICTHARDKGLIPKTGIPDWCPLPDEAVEEMLEIMEKARKWDKVKEIAERPLCDENNDPDCHINHKG